MSPRHQHLHASLQRLDQAQRVGLTNPPLRLVQPHYTRDANGGTTYPMTAYNRETPRYSTRCEAAIARIERKRARREVWRKRREAACAFAVIWLGAGVVGAALFWAIGILIRTVVVP